MGKSNLVVQFKASTIIITCAIYYLSPHNRDIDIITIFCSIYNCRLTQASLISKSGSSASWSEHPTAAGPPVPGFSTPAATMETVQECLTQ